jgi:hypothetical protein
MSRVDWLRRHRYKPPMLFTLLLWVGSAVADGNRAFVSDCTYADVSYSDDREVVWTHVTDECEIKPGVRVVSGAYVGWYKKDWEGARLGPAIGKLTGETEVLPGIRSRAEYRWSFVTVIYDDKGDLVQVIRLAEDVDLGCGVIAAQDASLSFLPGGRGLPFALVLARDLTVDGETFRAGDHVYFKKSGWGPWSRTEILHNSSNSGPEFRCSDWRYRDLQLRQ